MSRLSAFAACAALSLFVWRATTKPASVEAGTAVKLDIQGLVDRAQIVVEARVLSATAVVGPRGRIETQYVVRVDRALQGDVASSLTFRLPGGVLADGRGLVISGMPALAAGEDAILFLSSETPLGNRLPIGLAQGRFKVERQANGARRLVRDHAGLDLVDARGAQASAASPAVEFDYAATVAEIERAARAKRERAASQTLPQTPVKGESK